MPNVQFPTSYTIRTYQWTAWKVVQASKLLLTQFDDDGTVYTIYGYDGPEIHQCTIWKGTVPPAVQTLPDGSPGYTQTQNDADKAEFEAKYKPNANSVLQPRTSDGRLRQAAEKTITSKANFFSHNLCDKTTWYTSSVYVASEAPTDSGDHQTYTLANANVIDTYHGKLNQEDYLVDANGHSYRVTVKVNGTTKVEQDPHYAAAGGGPVWDFTIDYVNGKIVFQNALQPTDTVVVTYHYASTATDGTASRFKIVPASGKKLTLDTAKCQFTTDVDMTDTVMFQVMGLVDVFAPQLMPGIPSGTKIPIQYFPYKTIYDFGEDAHEPGAAVAAVGPGNSWRDAKALNVYRWQYIAGNVIHSSYGMEVWIFLVHDKTLSGTRATATFYCISENEP